MKLDDTKPDSVLRLNDAESASVTRFRHFLQFPHEGRPTEYDGWYCSGGIFPNLEDGVYYAVVLIDGYLALRGRKFVVLQ